jgi:type IX secretion system PorP/SprF family membrane protein
MLKNLYAGIASLMIMGGAYSQQLPQYSQYLRNQFMVNPAAAGVYDFVDITLSGRAQWLGFKNAPLTSYMSICAPLGKREKLRYNPPIAISSGPIRNPEINVGKLKHALGAQVLADQYGAFQRMNAAGTYALHLPISKNYNLSFGARVGISNNSFLQDKAIVANVAKDQTYTDYIAGSMNKYVLEIGSGLYLYSKKAFFGISADNLSRDMVTFGNGTVNFETKMHFNATAGYKIMLNDNFSVTPAILAKYMDPAPVCIEGSVQFEYMEWIWFGGSYRNKDAFIGMVGLNLSKKFKFGYSYDFSVTRFNSYSSGGHEVVLGIMLGRD